MWTKNKSKSIIWIIPVVLSIVVILFVFKPFESQTEVIKDADATLIEKEKDTVTVQSFSRIAVLPFLNSKLDQNSDYLGFAIADQIIENLSYLKNITVRPSSSVRKYENQTTEFNSAAEELNVDYILTGKYSLENKIIQLNVELLDIISNRIKWRDQIELDFKSIFELQDIIAKKIADNINLQFSQSEFKNITKDIPSNPIAYEYYLKGLALPYTIKGNKQAKELLEKSIELDSNYAPAYSQLADRSYRVSFFGIPDSTLYRSVEKIYLNALALNNELISAKTGLATYYIENGRTEEALEISNQILKIYPNNVDALLTLGYVLRYTGMDHESIKVMTKALENDPNNPSFRSLALSYSYLGDFDNAYKVFDSFEDDIWIMGNKGYFSYKQGNNEKAIELFNQIIVREPNSLYGLESTISKAKIEKDTLKGLQTLQTVDELNITDPEWLFFRACDYAIFGDKKGCNRTLNQAIDGGFFNYPLFISESSFDSMQDDLEFQEILLKAKVKHESFKEKYLNTFE